MLKFVAFALVINMVAAATFQSRLPKIPHELSHKKGCYVEDINDVIPFGKELTPIGACFRIECSRYGLFYATCGVVGTDDPKCFVTDVDLSRPYPSCCPDVRCELDNTIQDNFI